MIEVRGLVKSYGSFRALDGLDASVPDGAVYGLVGPNGAGKSTLIRHLAGIYRQDAGTVLIGGEQVYENPAVKGRIAYIPDEVFYYGQASAMDMMRFYRDMYPRFDRQRFDALGELFRLDPKCPIRRLSKGMQKQAAFWLALSARPEILILDDSASALDYATDAALRTALKNLDYKPTLIIVSQRTSSIMHADKIITLEDGKIAGIGTHEELLESCPVYREIYESQYKKEA